MDCSFFGILLKNNKSCEDSINAPDICHKTNIANNAGPLINVAATENTANEAKPHVNQKRAPYFLINFPINKLTKTYGKTPIDKIVPNVSFELHNLISFYFFHL